MKNNRNDVVLHHRRRIASLNAIHPGLEGDGTAGYA